MPKTRAFRILWANFYCLMDRSSGASLACREIIRSLARLGVETEIIGATTSDAASGLSFIDELIDRKEFHNKTIQVNDGEISHKLLVTKSSDALQITKQEINSLLGNYIATLKSFKPDLILSYGGRHTDMYFQNQARKRKIPFVQYLGNAHYHGSAFAQDTDCLLTDSQATAQLYEERIGIRPHPIGSFINPDMILADMNMGERRNVTFVNPVLSKGAGVVAMLADVMSRINPEIKFEVIDSRGSWGEVVNQFKLDHGSKYSFDNVIVTPTQKDMREVYKRCKILIAPSLAWESSGRVLAEAVMNSIPCIHTNMGGMGEMVGEAGIVVRLPESAHEDPYTTIPSPSALEPLARLISELFNNDSKYQYYVNLCRQVALERHDMMKNGRKLLEIIKPLMNLKAGDSDPEELFRSSHKILGNNAS